MKWLSIAKVDCYKLAWKDADRLGAMVNWYRATGSYVPSLEEVHQVMPYMPSDAMRISLPHLAGPTNKKTF